MARFALASQETVEPHRFEVFDFTGVGEDSVGALSADVRALYFEPDFERVLDQAAADLDSVSDPEAIRELVRRSVLDTLPEAGRRQSEPWLDMARNELAEVVCYAALEELYDATLPAKRVRHKEVPGLMSRGMDALALREEPGSPHGVRIFLSESKASSSERSPPPVVGEGAESLHAQLAAAVRERSRVTAELARALRYAGGDRSLVARAMVLWSMGALPTTIVPFLLRPVDRHGSGDFGCFRSDPIAYAPAEVAFCLVRIEGTIEALAKAVYGRARA